MDCGLSYGIGVFMATALKGKGKGKEKGNIGSFEMYPSTFLLAPQVYTEMKSSRFASSVQIYLRIALLLFSSTHTFSHAT